MCGYQGGMERGGRNLETGTDTHTTIAALLKIHEYRCLCMCINLDFPEDTYTGPQGTCSAAFITREGQSRRPVSCALSWAGPRGPLTQRAHTRYSRWGGNRCSQNENSMEVLYETRHGCRAQELHSCADTQRVIIRNDIFTPFSQHCY